MLSLAAAVIGGGCSAHDNQCKKVVDVSEEHLNEEDFSVCV
jgi:hypothetical protein